MFERVFVLLLDNVDIDDISVWFAFILFFWFFIPRPVNLLFICYFFCFFLMPEADNLSKSYEPWSVWM